MTISSYNLTIAGKTHKLFFDLEPEQFYSDWALNVMLPRGQVPEPEVINALPHLLKPGDCCVDAGANVGFFSIVMSRLVGPTGKVIAIEPDPRNAAKLRKNLDINECVNVSVHEQAVSDTCKNPAGKFYIHGENGSSSLFEGPEDVVGKLVETVPMVTTTLSAILDFEGRKPTLLKMDIEGAELLAMQGCNYKFPFVISEINEDALKRGGASIDKLRYHFEHILGMATHVLDPGGSMPAKLADAYTQKIVASKPNTNVLFAREWDVVKAWPEVKL